MKVESYDGMYRKEAIDKSNPPSLVKVAFFCLTHLVCVSFRCQIVVTKHLE